MKNSSCTLIVVLLSLIAALIWAQNPSSLDDKNKLLKESQGIPLRLSEAIDDFSIKVLLEMSKSKENLIFSPFSLHNALSILFYGSPDDSQTHEQLKTLLGLNRPDYLKDYLYNYLKILSEYKNNPYVRVANRPFVDSSISLLGDFTNILYLFYESTAESVDFQSNPSKAVQIINDYVAENTGIRDLLAETDISSLTKLILVNAIYFKGNWKTRFPLKLTSPGIFTNSDGSSVNYPQFMKHKAEYWLRESSENDALNAHVLEMPYENEKMAMLIFLPLESSSLSLLESQMTPGVFSSVMSQMVPRQVNVALPRFELNLKTDMASIFKNLGVTDVFDSSLSNLRDITATRDTLFVESIIHQAKISVTEEGVEASAATAVVVGIRSSATTTRTFNFFVNRPFLYAIMDKGNKVPLFIGKVVQLNG